MFKKFEPKKRGLFNLPAGTLELDEDIVACAIRETKEETGIDTIPDCFVGVHQSVLATGDNIIFFVFAVTVPITAPFHSDEHTIIETLSYKQLQLYAIRKNLERQLF